MRASELWYPEERDKYKTSTQKKVEKALEQAKKRFEEAAGIFFEETAKKGTLENALLNLGWQKIQKVWQPPFLIGQGFQQVAGKYH